MDNNKETKKEITIDDLARLVVERFDTVDEKIDKLAGEQAEMKTSIDNIEANLNKKVDKIEHNTLTYRVEKLEEKLASA